MSVSHKKEKDKIFFDSAIKLFKDKGINDTDAKGLMTRVYYDPKALDRLKRLIHGDILKQDISFSVEFNKFIEVVPDWTLSADVLHFATYCEEVYNHVLDKPYFVSGFEIYSNCQAKNKFSYTMADVIHDEKPIGSHSMVLIGCRKPTDERYFFILQNWWSSKYFIEVSAKYLQYCRAELTYVKRAITRMNNVIVHEGYYFETSIDEFGDMLLDEV